MGGLACPYRAQSDIDPGLRMSHILCFWSLGLGSLSGPNPARQSAQWVLG